MRLAGAGRIFAAHASFRVCRSSAAGLCDLFGTFAGYLSTGRAVQQRTLGFVTAVPIIQQHTCGTHRASTQRVLAR